MFWVLVALAVLLGVVAFNLEMLTREHRETNRILREILKKLGQGNAE